MRRRNEEEEGGGGRRRKKKEEEEEEEEERVADLEVVADGHSCAAEQVGVAQGERAREVLGSKFR